MSIESLNLAAAFPEIFISIMACVILLVRLYDNSCRRNMIPYVLSVVTLLLAGAASIGQFGMEPSLAFGEAYQFDALTVTAKAFIAFLVAAVFVYSARYNDAYGYFKTEFYVLGLLGTVGMMLMAASANLLTLYVGLELMSLSMYALVAFFRDSERSTEAAMKYFVLGALASAILLYALSLLYGLSGSLNISEISARISELGPNNLGVQLAVVLVVVGVGFKLGLIPFHMWVPDVYQGSPTSVTAFLSAAPKIAAFAMVYRLLVEALGSQIINWQAILLILALLSVGLGNILAIAQTNFKRMLAYSTISHMGFFLFGIASATEQGYAASYFYMIIYAVMSIAAFGFIQMFARKGYDFDELSDLKGFASNHPWMGFLLLILMFSMAGVPPFAGFFAKFSVVQALVAADLAWVAIIAVLLAVIGAYYYLRVIKLVYFDDSDNVQVCLASTAVRWFFSANVLLLLAILPWIGTLIDLTQSVFS